MKFFAIVCLAMIAAVNARPDGAVLAAPEASYGTYTNIADARASAADIAKAGAGLDVLEGQLKVFSEAAAAGTISTAEAAVEAVATPYVPTVPLATR